MTKEFWTIIQAALWGNNVERLTVSAERMSKVVSLCAMQGVGPLVYPMLLAESNEQLSDALRAQMKAVCVHSMQTQAQIYRIQEQAYRALEKAGIQAVLMKGAGLAALYPTPEQRQWGDVDLFVGKNQYHQAARVMRETFPNALKFDEEMDHYKHYNLIADGVSIEIHRVSVSLSHPCDVRRYARMEEQGMTKSNERIMVNGLEVRVPEPTFNTLMVFLHSWEHMLTQGANLRQLCDLALLLHHYHDRIDTKRLKRCLRALCLTDVWQLYMWIMVNDLGLALDQAFFYTDAVQARAERLMNALLTGQMTEQKNAIESKPSTNRFVRKWGTMQVRLANVRRIKPYSPAYARHLVWAVLLSGAARLFAKDRHWE